MNKLTHIRILQEGGSPSEKYPVSTLAQQVLLSEGSTETIVDALNNMQNQLYQLSSNKVDMTDFNDETNSLQNAINEKLNINDFNESSLKVTDLKDAATARYESVTATNQANRQYPVVRDSNGKLSVNVPWIDTNNEINDNTHEKLGQGYGTCSTSSSERNKKAILSGYKKLNGGIVSIYFTNKISGNASLNINNTGATQIRYQNRALVDNIVLAKDTVTFIYDGNYFRIISIDRDNNDNTTYPSMSENQSDNLISNTPYVISPKVLNTKINKTVNAKKITATGDGLVTFSID